MDAIGIAKSLNDAGLLVILTVALIIVWRAYVNSVNDHINDLRKIAGLGGSLQSDQPTSPESPAEASIPDAI